MTRSLIIAITFLIASCAIHNESKVNAQNYMPFEKANGSLEDRKEFIEFTLKHIKQANSTVMFFSARNCMEQGRLEDAAFLYYGAQARAKVDFYRFPSSDAMVALGAVNRVVGSAVNPAIFRDPKAYSKVLSRLESWNVLPEGEYDPGWEWDKSQGRAIEDSNVYAKNVKDEMILHMGQQSELLNDREYFKAVLIVQEYNLAPESNITEKTYKEAVATVKEIEKEKGYAVISGML